MPESCTVLIAAPEALASLKQRTDRDGNETVAFTDADALGALETIMKRRPSVVALERAFAATPRGAALIDRIKADPALARAEIRVMSEEIDTARINRSAEGNLPTITATAEAPVIEQLDACGTRRAARFQMTAGIDVLIDGSPAALVDLSAVGAQVLSQTALKPNQRVRLTLPDARGAIRVSGTIAWATFEIPHRYRAGIAFTDPDSEAIHAYALGHQAARG